jgi:hypothetical protein
MSVAFVGFSVFVGLVFLLVVVLRSTTPPRAEHLPSELKPGWKADPSGRADAVRYWDGRQWATVSTSGDPERAASWPAPRRRHSPSSTLRVVGIAILAPLLVLTPIVTLLAMALSQLHSSVNMGGSNK